MRRILHIIAIAAAVLMAACASVGRPEGGPRDVLPPEPVRSYPAMGETNVRRTDFSVVFDENIALDDAFNKVVISPVQSEPPQVSANGRRVSIALRDTLVPNTTYTIDFGDAIKDLNEGNVLDGFALDFSTGDRIDTLRVSGRVLRASNLEPAQGILVAAYANTADSAIRTLRPDRIARTNQYGQFTLRNLADRDYRIYALEDINRDYHWDRSENVAYLDELVHPYVEAVWVTDTLYDSHRGDSLVQREGRRYLPNDLLLTWFNEDYRAQYLRDYSRPERRKIQLLLGAAPDTLPTVRAIDGPHAGETSDRWTLTEYSPARDSIVMWLTDTAMVATDSLRLAVTYQKPDSLERLVWNTDTLRFFFRSPKPKKKSKKEQEADTLPPAKALLDVSLASGQSQELNLPLKLKFSQPLASLDTAGVRLELQVDTLWKSTGIPAIQPDPDNPLLGIIIPRIWEPGGKYRLTIDSAAMQGIYDEHNRPVEVSFTVKKPEDYSSIRFAMQGADTTAIVELLNTSDAMVASAPVGPDGTARFTYVAPGTYYARMYFDTDRNGKWSTGVLDSIQPEEVAYYPKKIELKKNWEIEQTWDIYATAIDAQKPYAILKNKPKLKRGEERPVEEEEDEDPTFGSDPYNTNRTGNQRYNSAHGSTGGMGSGRFQRNGTF